MNIVKLQRVQKNLRGRIISLEGGKWIFFDEGFGFKFFTWYVSCSKNLKNFPCWSNFFRLVEGYKRCFRLYRFSWRRFQWLGRLGWMFTIMWAGTKDSNPNLYKSWTWTWRWRLWWRGPANCSLQGGRLPRWIDIPFNSNFRSLSLILNSYTLN
mgnify:CR=1 FL=1